MSDINPTPDPSQGKAKSPGSVKIYDRPDRKGLSPAMLAVLLVILVLLIYFIYRMVVRH